MKKTKKAYVAIIFIVLLGCMTMAFVDAVMMPKYFMKSMIKVICFLIVPMLYFWKSKDAYYKQIFIPTKNGFMQSLMLGILVFVVILCAYLIVSQFYDFSQITSILMNQVGVSNDNFIYVSFYIAIFNSFLEEFFFRGFAFLTLKKYIGRQKAYSLSSLCFALYHVAIIKGWFSPLLFVLAILVLMIGGIIFNYIDEKKENIYHSWMVHMFANVGINIVGMILFGMIG